MEREERKEKAAGETGEGSVAGVGDIPRESVVRPSPAWRTWVISIIVAVILSVTATLLLGGSFRLPGTGAGMSGGCGLGSACCPPAGNK